MATATIKKRAGDWFAETESVTLVLTAEEAATILLVVRKVSGSPNFSPRRFADEVEMVLESETGIPVISTEVEGFVCFEDGDVRDYFK